jgi:hypothetical protein
VCADLYMIQGSGINQASRGLSEVSGQRMTAA